MSALQHRDFRFLWIGSVATSFGAQFTQIATAWQIYELTNSPLQLGLLGLARGLPSIVILLFGGLLADAVDRRRLVQFTQVGQTAVCFFLAYCAVADTISPGVLYVASMFLALFGSLETPARQALVPNLVPRVDLANALAVNSVQRQTANIAGPAIAGVLLAATGPTACYAINGCTWLLGILTLQILHPTPQAAGGRGAVSLVALREGLQFVWTHPVILSMMALDFGQNFFGNPRGLLPVFAKDILNVGPEGLGLLYAANAAGALVMAVVLSVHGEFRRYGLWVLATVAAYGVFGALFGISSMFWVSFLMLAGAGASNAMSAVMRGTINQLATPDHIRGRVTSVNSMFTHTGPQLGQFESGALASIIGPVGAMVFGGMAVTAIAGAVFAASGRVRQFEIGDPVPPEAATTPR